MGRGSSKWLRCQIIDSTLLHKKKNAREFIQGLCQKKKNYSLVWMVPYARLRGALMKISAPHIPSFAHLLRDEHSVGAFGDLTNGRACQKSVKFVSLLSHVLP